jgi:hypothetical protein
MNRLPLGRRLYGFAPIAFLATFGVLLVAGRSSFFRDPGTFWHTATGNQILDTKTFITTDPFTYTFCGQEWTPYEWLGEVVMAIAYRLGGFDLQLLGAVSLLAITFALLGDRLARTGLHWAACACLTGLAVAAASNHFHVRPHLITIACLAYAMAHLAAVEAGRRSLGSLLTFVPLFVVWTNAHGGALGGYATVGLVFAGWLVLWLLRLESPVTSWRQAVGLGAIGLAIAATAVVTPYGLDVPKTWWRLMQMPELKTFVIEHMPANIRDPNNAPFFAFGTIYAGLLLGLRRMPRATWLMPVVWFALGCDRCRHESLFAVMALVAIADLFPETAWAKWIAKRRPDYFVAGFAERFTRWSLVVPAAVVASTAVLHVGGSTLPIVGRGWVRFDPERWPVELLETIRREADGGRGLPIFNEYNDGGFLIWFAPEYRPFVDDRCEVFGGAWLKRFTDAAKSDPETVREYLETNQSIYGNFDHALTNIGSGFDFYFRDQPDDWRLVAESRGHAFYRRANAPHRVTTIAMPD